MSNTHLIVGLGNPGTEYQHTRHNSGFMVVEEYARQVTVTIAKKECQALTGRFTLDGKTVILALPQTFMNRSGLAVRELLDYYKISILDLLVIYDDLDFVLGEAKLRTKGSGGSHNGINSVIEQLGTTDFARLRIGIGPRPVEWTGKDFVLSNFRQEDNLLVDHAIEKAGKGINGFIAHGAEKAMNSVNS